MGLIIFFLFCYLVSLMVVTGVVRFIGEKIGGKIGLFFASRTGLLAAFFIGFCVMTALAQGFPINQLIRF